jgi:L-2,4-diaminobutyrate decarboxylase
MALTALDAALGAMDRAGEVPIAVVGTAGTTDLGAIDPLDGLADRAAACGAWLHVDAAVGSGLALSARHRHLLDGIGRADSVTADLHKLWFQPFAASALLVRDPAAFAAVREESDYLDRDDDLASGVVNLVGRSLDTSRRFDALKVVASLRAVGLDRMGALVDHLVELAAHAGDAVRACPGLELVAPPQTVTCVFRWTGDDDPDATMTVAARRLFADGRAVVGRTRIDGRVALKLTFVNPVATADDARRLVLLAADECRAVAASGQTG